MTDQSTHFTAPTPRHVPPLVLLTLVLVVGFAALIGLITVIGRLEPPQPLFNLPTLAEATMPDGTILSVHAVKAGTSPHELHIDVPLQNGFFLSGTQQQTTYFHPNSSQVSVWMTRRDAKTGKSLDFEWWKRSTIIDQFGDELSDRDPQREIFAGHRQSRSGGSRPFAVETSTEQQGNARLVLVASGFKAFRADKTVKLRVYNTSDELVAELNIPNPVTLPTTEWTPEPLPASKSDGDLEVTLKSLSIREHRYKSQQEEQHSWDTTPEFSFRQGGQETQSWYGNLSLSDALGNHNGGWNSNLSTRESAWKARVTCFRHQNAQFGPNEVIESDWIDLPTANQTNLLSLTLKNAAHSFEVARTIGPGEVEFTENIGVNTGNYSSNGQLENDKMYEVRFKSVGGTIASITLKSEWPCLLVKGIKWEGYQSITHEITDEAGNILKHAGGGHVSDHQLLFIKPAPELKRVKLKTRFQQARVVEFFISPPKIEVQK